MADYTPDKTDRTIDFAKVDAAFQKLADTATGNDALEGLNRAILNINRQFTELNENEFHYLITNLVMQRQGGFGPNIKSSETGGARIKNGFLIKTAVPA